LFDHLASGSPVVATTACDQCGAYGDRVSVCEDAQSFSEAVLMRIGDRFDRCEGITWNDRASEMITVMEELNIA